MEATLIVLRGPRTLKLERGWLVIRTTEFGSVSHFTARANAAWKHYGVERDLAVNAGHIAIAERAARLAEELAEEERVARRRPRWRPLSTNSSMTSPDRREPWI